MDDNEILSSKSYKITSLICQNDDFKLYQMAKQVDRSEEYILKVLLDGQTPIDQQCVVDSFPLTLGKLGLVYDAQSSFKEEGPDYFSYWNICKRAKAHNDENLKQHDNENKDLPLLKFDEHEHEKVCRLIPKSNLNDIPKTPMPQERSLTHPIKKDYFRTSIFHGQQVVRTPMPTNLQSNMDDSDDSNDSDDSDDSNDSDDSCDDEDDYEDDYEDEDGYEDEDDIHKSDEYEFSGSLRNQCRAETLEIEQEVRRVSIVSKDDSTLVSILSNNSNDVTETNMVLNGVPTPPDETTITSCHVQIESPHLNVKHLHHTKDIPRTPMPKVMGALSNEGCDPNFTKENTSSLCSEFHLKMLQSSMLKRRKTKDVSQ